MPTKYRDGYDATGMHGAVYLRDLLDRPHAQKRTIGARVKKCGDFIEVFKDKPGLGAIYSVGRNTSGVSQIWGSTTATGDFSYVGLPQDGLSTLSNFVYYGKRLGASVSSHTSLAGSSIVDFNGASWNQLAYSVYRGRNGVAPDGYYVVDVVYPAWAGVFATELQFAASGVYKVGGVNTFYTGASITQMTTGGQPHHMFIVDDGTTFSFGAALGYTNAIPWYGETSTLAPGVLFKVDRYLRSTSPYTLADPFVFTYSSDAGNTWSVAPAQPLIATELATLVALTTSSTDLTNIVNATNWFKWLTAPLSRTQSVVVTAMPYMSGGSLKSRVKMGVLDATTMTTTGSVVLYDNAAPQDAANFLKCLIATKNGVIVATRPFTPDSSIFSRAAQLQVTTDGVGLTNVGYLPYVETASAPNIRALDTGTLVIPVYDAPTTSYLLMQSKDFGVTWTQRATITTNGIVPPGGLSNMTDFADIAYIRQGDSFPTEFPATPWLTDIRVSP